MKVGELMQTKVLTVGADESADKAWNQMRSLHVRHLVVMREGKVAGILSDRDLAGERGIELREGRTVARMMTPGAVTASPDTTLREAAGLMRTHDIGCLPVMQEGKLRGIVTTSDLLDYLLAHPEACCSGTGTAGKRD